LAQESAATNPARCPFIPWEDSSYPLGTRSFPIWTVHGIICQMTATTRVLIHLPDSRIPLEPEEVFFLEAIGDETEVRTRGSRRLRDVRSLGELVRRFPPGLFVLVHRSYAVNVDRVAEVRRRATGRDWEVKLEPPVNRILPIGRTHLADLWAAYGDE